MRTTLRLDLDGFEYADIYRADRLPILDVVVRHPAGDRIDSHATEQIRPA